VCGNIPNKRRPGGFFFSLIHGQMPHVVDIPCSRYNAMIYAPHMSCSNEAFAERTPWEPKTSSRAQLRGCGVASSVARYCLITQSGGTPLTWRCLNPLDPADPGILRFFRHSRHRDPHDPYTSTYSILYLSTPDTVSPPTIHSFERTFALSVNCTALASTSFRETR
jgi:hypothetical protein